MNDFKKGLLVGMLIIIGCGVFVANTSDNDVGRYSMYNKEDGSYITMLDTKSGDLYVHGYADGLLFYSMASQKKWSKMKEIVN